MLARRVVDCSGAGPDPVTVKIGVLTRHVGLYAELAGPGSVVAAKMAVEDFAKADPNVKVEIVSADHQNKPDVGTNIAQPVVRRRQAST